MDGAATEVGLFSIRTRFIGTERDMHEPNDYFFATDSNGFVVLALRKFNANDLHVVPILLCNELCNMCPEQDLQIWPCQDVLSKVSCLRWHSRPVVIHIGHYGLASVSTNLWNRTELVYLLTCAKLVSLMSCRDRYKNALCSPRGCLWMYWNRGWMEYRLRCTIGQIAWRLQK